MGLKLVVTIYDEYQKNKHGMFSLIVNIDFTEYRWKTGKTYRIEDRWD